MDGFGDMGMPSYLSSSMPTGDVDAETYHGVLPSLGLPESITPSYDTSDFTIPNEMTYVPTAPPQGSSHSYNNAYDDAFADTVALMEAMPPEQLIPEATSIDRDNKLLSFQLLSYNFTLLDISLRRTFISLAAQLHGMFFMAESQESGPTTTLAPPNELTCYRRNLFQITGSITLPRGLRYIMTDAGDRIPIIGQELYISATESVEGLPVKLISVPWKTPASHSSTTPEDKTEKEPASIPLDTMSNQDMDADFATFPIAWKRLQFRIATANNGRRKELQQHFVVRLRVVATLTTGAKVSICESRSAAIIVRGRSPRNFQARKDLPVGTAGSNNRRATAHPPGPLSRNSSESTCLHFKTEKSPDSGHATLDNQEIQTPSTFSEWTRKSNSASLSRGATVPAPPAPTFHHSSTRSTSTATMTSTPPRPKALSLNDSPERDPAPRLASHRSAKAARTSSMPNATAVTSASSVAAAAPATTNPAFLPSQIDAADLLYEYFPLGLDDWQPPVDAVYRPHVVHHIQAGSGGPGSGGGEGRTGRPSLGGRSKRYFSEDMSKVS
ncbi:MAG: hypothetical protein L6R35_000294 [Caloplaca aegaea]|nr:MAG: hypothetical protein L6R35_000294 [Caloplaca aegaea]